MGISIDEKRVYDASEGPTPVFVVGEFGVARVDTSDDLVGEFGLAHRCTARDAAGRGGLLGIATDEELLVGVFGDAETEVEFEPLGLGPTAAVGFAADGELVAAREDGTVVRGNATGGGETGDATGGDETGATSADSGGSASGWTELGELDDVRAIDGDLVAAESGVYRAVGDDLQHVGLEEVRDVSAAGVPLAATDDGLYRLGNGWMDVLNGAFRAVSAAPAETGSSARSLGWAHAAGADGLFAREEGAWQAVELPVSGEVVALDHGDGAYAVTADGTFLLSVGDGWHHQVLGLRGVEAVAVPSGQRNL
ncbi:HVO_0234 family beta-propeller protein [Halorussus salinus]|uniref:HVO_0234 family beta-propeller protein n=1 Tax=Halorussus salinus TaxID=1364935 RepID=UPI001091D55A|nr:hypothetical protein [Halorussus salinus]